MRFADDFDSSSSPIRWANREEEWVPTAGFVYNNSVEINNGECDEKLGGW
jgi:hypothetical protein